MACVLQNNYRWCNMRVNNYNALILMWPQQFVFFFHTRWVFGKKMIQDRSHQWSTRPAHSLGRQWLSLDFEVLGRTDTLCENSDHCRPSGLWAGRVDQKYNPYLPDKKIMFCSCFVATLWHFQNKWSRGEWFTKYLVV